MKLRLTLLATLSLAPTVSAGQVRVVGPAPGLLHDLQDAIILAQDGDVILVKSGTYESIRSVGRSVSIIAENGATVQLLGAIRVIDLSAKKTFVATGLSASGVWTPSLPETNTGLYMNGPAGQIVVQDCTFAGGSSSVVISNCAGVALARCSVVATPSSGGAGATGMMVRSGAHVSLDQVNTRGGNGASAPPPPVTWPNGCAGGPGLYYDAPLSGSPAFVFASDSLFTGGAGGNGSWGGSICTECGWGGSGGDGIFGYNPNGALALLGITAIGGPGGSYMPGCPGSGMCGGGGSGAPGQGIYAGHLLTTCSFAWSSPPTPFSQPAGTPRVVSGSTLVRDTERLVLNLRGTAGEFVEICVSLRQPTFVPATANGGVLHVQGNVWRRIGVVPSSGLLTERFKLPNLPLSDPGATFFVQARFIDPATGQLRLSNLHAVVEVDASY